MLLGFCWRTSNPAQVGALRVCRCLEELFSHLLKDLPALLLSAARFRSPHSRSCAASYHPLLSHPPLHFSCMNLVQYIHSSPMSKPRQPCLSSKPFNFNYPSLILLYDYPRIWFGKEFGVFGIQPSQLGVGLALGVCWLMTHVGRLPITTSMPENSVGMTGHELTLLQLPVCLHSDVPALVCFKDTGFLQKGKLKDGTDGILHLLSTNRIKTLKPAPFFHL